MDARYDRKLRLSMDKVTNATTELEAAKKAAEEAEEKAEKLYALH